MALALADKFNELQKASKVAAAARFTPRKMSDRQLRAANLHFPHFQPVRNFLTQKKNVIYIYLGKNTKVWNPTGSGVDCGLSRRQTNCVRKCFKLCTPPVFKLKLRKKK